MNIETSTLKKLAGYASGITAILALVFGLWKVDDRYAKATVLEKTLESNKISIITETRREIVKNRTAMIAQMEREFDDLEYEITTMIENATPVPRYLIEKQRQLRRDINTLRAQ